MIQVVIIIVLGIAIILNIIVLARLHAHYDKEMELYEAARREQVRRISEGV